MNASCQGYPAQASSPELFPVYAVSSETCSLFNGHLTLSLENLAAGPLNVGQCPMCGLSSTAALGLPGQASSCVTELKTDAFAPQSPPISKAPETIPVAAGGPQHGKANVQLGKPTCKIKEITAGENSDSVLPTDAVSWKQTSAHRPERRQTSLKR